MIAIKTNRQNFFIIESQIQLDKNKLNGAHPYILTNLFKKNLLLTIENFIITLGMW